MLQEAGEFASHLRKIEKDIRGLKTATEGAPPLLLLPAIAAASPLKAASLLAPQSRPFSPGLPAAVARRHPHVHQGRAVSAAAARV